MAANDTIVLVCPVKHDILGVPLMLFSHQVHSGQQRFSQVAADPVGGFNPLYSILQSILTLQYFTPPVGLLGGGTHYCLAVADIV